MAFTPHIQLSAYFCHFTVTSLSENNIQHSGGDPNSVLQPKLKEEKIKKQNLGSVRRGEQKEEYERFINYFNSKVLGPFLGALLPFVLTQKDDWIIILFLTLNSLK